MSSHEKEKALTRVSHAIMSCQFCQQHARGTIVPGEGNSNADIVFVGEAPGKKEAATGRPFIGRSGIFLRDAMGKIGIQEKKVFITSAVKYLPPTGTPTSQEIAHGRQHLFAQLALISPRLVVLLGRVACESLFMEYVSVEKKHGVTEQQEGYIVFISYHPAAAIRFTSIREKFIKDFSHLAEIIARLS